MLRGGWEDERVKDALGALVSLARPASRELGWNALGKSLLRLTKLTSVALLRKEASAVKNAVFVWSGSCGQGIGSLIPEMRKLSQPRPVESVTCSNAS